MTGLYESGKATLAAVTRTPQNGFPLLTFVSHARHCPTWVGR